MKARILNVGDEVLSGKTINTNASFIAENLLTIGIDIDKIIVIADSKYDIASELNSFISSDSELIITTGGLGPTHDDITKETLASFLKLGLVENKEAMDLLRSHFDNNIRSSNLKQALFPRDAIIIPNHNGTADGAIIEKDGKIYIILVGPPHELNPMMSDTVIPYLKTKTNNNKISKEFIVMGNGESFFEEYLSEFYVKYPEVSVNPYAGIGSIRYKLISKIDNGLVFNNAVNDFILLMDKYIISDNDEDIEEVVVRKLHKLNYNISFAESITGGILASKIVNVSGASNVFKESFVTYSNEVKMKTLGVKKETLDKYGVVSDEVAHEMVEGLSKLSDADVLISVTGVAGPATLDDKEVGSTHYAIKILGKIYVESKKFRGSREKIRTLASLWIMYRLSLLLDDKIIEISSN